MATKKKESIKNSAKTVEGKFFIIDADGSQVSAGYDCSGQFDSLADAKQWCTDHATAVVDDSCGVQIVQAILSVKGIGLEFTPA